LKDGRDKKGGTRGRSGSNVDSEEKGRKSGREMRISAERKWSKEEKDISMRKDWDLRQAKTLGRERGQSTIGTIRNGTRRGTGKEGEGRFLEEGD